MFFLIPIIFYNFDKKTILIKAPTWTKEYILLCIPYISLGSQKCNTKIRTKLYYRKPFKNLIECRDGDNQRKGKKQSRFTDLADIGYDNFKNSPKAKQTKEKVNESVIIVPFKPEKLCDSIKVRHMRIGIVCAQRMQTAKNQKKYNTHQASKAISFIQPDYEGKCNNKTNTFSRSQSWRMLGIDRRNHPNEHIKSIDKLV